MSAAALIGVAATTATAGASTAFADTASSPAPTASVSTGPSPSPSAGGRSLSAIQQHAAAAISQRLTSLNAGIASVNGNSAITVADRASLLTTLTNDVAGLTALGTRIAADTATKQAAADTKTIFTGYRVYALALPQVHYAAAADDLTGTVLPKLTDAQTKLAALLAGPDAGKNTAAVQAAMGDLANQLAAIANATNGESAAVLAYTPAQYNANPALLSPARANLKSARTDVKAARADVQTVMGALK